MASLGQLLTARHAAKIDSLLRFLAASDMHDLPRTLFVKACGIASDTHTESVEAAVWDPTTPVTLFDACRA